MRFTQSTILFNLPQLGIGPSRDTRRPPAVALSMATRLKRCGHQGCSLWTSDCCACADRRPRAPDDKYEVYVDGKGYRRVATRSQGYCHMCRERAVAPGGPVPGASIPPPRLPPPQRQRSAQREASLVMEALPGESDADFARRLSEMLTHEASVPRGAFSGRAAAAAPAPPMPAPAPTPEMPEPVEPARGGGGASSSAAPASASAPRATAEAVAAAPRATASASSGGDESGTGDAIGGGSLSGLDAAAIEDALSCPICLGMLTLPVTTVCGHTFCRECILGVAAGVGGGGRLPCPLDRRPLDVAVLRQTAPNRTIADLITLVMRHL